jgi:hypothetical protein
MSIDDLKEEVIAQIKNVNSQDTLLKLQQVLKDSKSPSSTFEGLPDFEDEGEISLSDFRSKIRDRVGE